MVAAPTMLFSFQEFPSFQIIFISPSNEFNLLSASAMLPPLIKLRVRRYLLLDFTKVIVFHIATVCEIFADKYLQRTFLHAPVVGSTHNIVIEKQLPKNKNAEIYAVQC